MRISRVRKLMRISIHKTILFNYIYLGIKGLFRPAFLIGKNVVLCNCLKGQVELQGTYKTFGIHIGVQENELSYYKSDKSIWNNCGKVIFRGRANLGCGIKIVFLQAGTVVFGENCSINGNTEIIASKQVEFGKDANISWGCLFIDTDFHSVYDIVGNCINENRSITIGNNVWIGARSIILKGVHLCDNTIVGAGSMITRDNSQCNQIIVGNNRVVGENATWKMEMAKDIRKRKN